MPSVFTLCALLPAVLLLVSFWIPQMTPNMEKMAPYECGFSPFGSARLPFSLAFFLVAISFLLFDLEIALLIPLPWGNNLPNPTKTFYLASALIVLLTAGLVYEWNKGGLEWTS